MLNTLGEMPAVIIRDNKIKFMKQNLHWQYAYNFIENNSSN